MECTYLYEFEDNEFIIKYASQQYTTNKTWLKEECTRIHITFMSFSVSQLQIKSLN